jgi:tRNA U38,U39,U40 pseudouridine synthase TruA
MSEGHVDVENAKSSEVKQKSGYRSKKGNKIGQAETVPDPVADDLHAVLLSEVPSEGGGGLERNTYIHSIEGRNWDEATDFWKRCLNVYTLPSFIQGHQEAEAEAEVEAEAGHQLAYDPNSLGVTQMQAMQRSWLASGLPLTELKKGKQVRTNYACRIGYVGSEYHGYQKQNDGLGLLTVEDDLLLALDGQKTVPAGRTDKDVSACSQIVCFHRYDSLSPQDILNKAIESEPCKNGRLRIYECVPMPRRFHSLFSATWRRYVYVLPLNRTTGSTWVKSVYTDMNVKGMKPVAEDEEQIYKPMGEGSLFPSSWDTTNGLDIDTAFVDQALRHLENRTIHCNCFTTSKEIYADSDLCTMFRSRAQVVDLCDDPDQTTGSSSRSPSSSSSVIAKDVSKMKSPALSIELVGSRFLRCMVRIIVSTVVRESYRPVVDRREDVLLQCAASGRRVMSATPILGKGLALAGVGYTLEKAMQHGSNAKAVNAARQSANGDGDGKVISQRMQRKKRKANQVPLAIQDDGEDKDGNDDSGGK